MMRKLTLWVLPIFMTLLSGFSINAMAQTAANDPFAALAKDPIRGLDPYIRANLMNDINGRIALDKDIKQHPDIRDDTKGKTVFLILVSLFLKDAQANPSKGLKVTYESMAPYITQAYNQWKDGRMRNMDYLQKFCMTEFKRHRINIANDPKMPNKMDNLALECSDIIDNLMLNGVQYYHGALPSSIQTDITNAIEAPAKLTVLTSKYGIITLESIFAPRKSILKAEIRKKVEFYSNSKKPADIDKQTNKVYNNFYNDYKQKDQAAGGKLPIEQDDLPRKAFEYGWSHATD